MLYNTHTTNVTYITTKKHKYGVRFQISTYRYLTGRMITLQLRDTGYKYTHKMIHHIPTNVPSFSGHFLVPLVLCYVQTCICNSSSNFKVVPTFLQTNQVFPFTQIQQANGTMFHHFQARDDTLSRLQR